MTRVGVVLNSTTCSYSFYTVISEWSLSGDIDLYFLIYPQSKQKCTHSFFNVITYFEKAIISWFESDIRTFNSRKSVLLLSYHDRIDLSDVSECSQLQSLGLDIIIQDPSMGSIVLSLIPYSKQGVVSLSMGNDYSYFYGLSVFWAVYLQKVSIGFEISKQTIHDDCPLVMFKGELPVSGTYTETLASVIKRSYSYLMHVMSNDIDDVDNTRDKSLQKVEINKSLNLGVPSWIQLLHYLGQIIIRGIRNIIHGFKGGQQWGVAFVNKSWNETTLAEGIQIKNPPSRWFADPFVVTRNNRTICFVEEYWNSKQRACISAVELFDNNEYHILGPVIEESFHMSFPYVFEYQNELYMVPETSENNEIRLYRCVAFPLKWTYVKSLMTEISAADTLIFNYDDKWWLLTNVPVNGDSNHCYQLNIYYTTDLINGDWVSHNHNPVLVDSMIARNGGIIFSDGQLPIRCRQKQGFDCYGKGLTLAKLTQLTRETFVEEQISEINPDFFDRIIGNHHLHSDGVYTVYDYRLR
jgi:hypothetical protein